MTFKNESGLRPVEYKVVVKPDSVEKKTAGGIIITERHSDRQQMAQVKGTLVAVGGKAFTGSCWGEEEVLKLVPGARVCYDKYEGITFYGADEDEYKLLIDKGIAGLVLDERAVPLHAVRGRSRAGLDAA